MVKPEERDLVEKLHIGVADVVDIAVAVHVFFFDIGDYCHNGRQLEE